jgi:hypothetical protein
MGRYLLVAHQTASSPELRSRVLRLLEEDPAAEFVLLVPATPIGLLQSVGGENRTALEIAGLRARDARSQLEKAGARVTAARIGNYDPVAAVEEELLSDDYDGVVISTLPPGVSRWLRLDLPARVSRRFPRTPVIQVVAHSSGGPWGRVGDSGGQRSGSEPPAP